MLELADAAPHRTGESAGLVAEELTVHQRFGQSAAVDRDEVAAPPLAVVVQATSDEILAGTRLAVDDDVGRRRGQRTNELAHALHLRGASDQRPP